MIELHIKKISEILDLTVEDIVLHCGVSSRTAYRWLAGETIARGEDRAQLFGLVVKKLEGRKARVSQDRIHGVVKFVIRVKGLIITHAEPYLHPLFKVNMLGKCVSEIYTDGLNAPEMQAQIFKLVLMGKSVCIEHCSTYKGSFRLSVAWFHSMPDKKHVRYIESWYDQFVLPKK